MPHTKEWYESQVEQEAFDLNNPLLPISGECSIMSGSLFTFSQDNIEVDCIKRAEYADHIIVRFHEFMGKRSEIKVESSLAIDKWYECDLMEQPLEEEQHTPIAMFIKPYEIKTIAIQLK